MKDIPFEFLGNLKKDIITYIIRRMGRGPIAPSENISSVFQGQMISLEEITSMFSLMHATVDSRQLVNDILASLKEETITQEGSSKRKQLQINGAASFLKENSDSDNIIDMPAYTNSSARNNQVSDPVPLLKESNTPDNIIDMNAYINSSARSKQISNTNLNKGVNPIEKISA